MKEYLEILNLGNKFQKFIPNPINVQQTNLHKNRRSFFLYVGTLSDEKGITELCNNWKIDYPNLFVIGDGPSRNKLPIKSNIQYLGYQNRSQVLDFISKAKALIIPSLCLENLPTVYIEAMSQGTPVLVNAKCSVSSLVFEEKTGEIFSNFSDIYHHLVELENNWTIFNQNASKAYETIYSDDVVRSQLISLYKDLYVER
jgi:glycosyltransferase involved in cell wall biosynthesis